VWLRILLPLNRATASSSRVRSANVAYAKAGDAPEHEIANDSRGLNVYLPCFNPLSKLSIRAVVGKIHEQTSATSGRIGNPGFEAFPEIP